MTIKLLIDECLSPELVHLAHQRGHVAVAVRDRGWTGLKDHEVVAKALEHDMVLVTRNAGISVGHPSAPPEASCARWSCTRGSCASTARRTPGSASRSSSC